MATERTPTSSRRRLGETLRACRTREGMTLAQLGAMIGVDRTQLGRIERGMWRPDVGLVMNILDRLDVGRDEYDRIVLMARAADNGWWKSLRGQAHQRHRALAELESGTASIREFGAVSIPGLLQTEDYSRFRFSDYPAFADPSAVERAVRARLTRREVLFADEAFRYEVVLDEAVLRRRSCPADTMRDQLDHLIDLGTSRETVVIRVLPLKSPVHERVSWANSFSVLSYHDPEETDAVFVETLTFDPVVRDPQDVTWYEGVYDKLRDASMTADDSVKLIRAVTRDVDW
ncbi:MAG: helix-turn-helix transcriptional regulator [Actinocatenispora sp.]